jgi:hypothetical protein
VTWQAVVGTMTDFLLREVTPSAADVAHLVAFCLAGAGVADGT